MDKIIRFGTVDLGTETDVFCRIIYDNGRLSITGVEGPRYGGDCRGSCGQIVMHLKADAIVPAPGWTNEMIGEFLRVWDRWHLNDMIAGSPAQMEELRRHTYPGGMCSHYEWAIEVLTAARLNPDMGYKYGSEWLREDVPEDVLTFLAGLPETDRKPAWV